MYLLFLSVFSVCGDIIKNIIKTVVLPLVLCSYGDNRLHTYKIVYCYEKSSYNPFYRMYSYFRFCNNMFLDKSFVEL